MLLLWQILTVCPAQPLSPRSPGGPPVYLPCQLDREPRFHTDSFTVVYPPLLQQAGIEGLARVIEPQSSEPSSPGRMS